LERGGLQKAPITTNLEAIAAGAPAHSTASERCQKTWQLVCAKLCDADVGKQPNAM
jgi:hypothetical protein